MVERNFWLLKTEPEEFSWADIQQDGESVWDGVKAPPALKNMARMRPGDGVLIYHTGRQRAVVGVAEVTAGPYPDPMVNDPRRLVVKVSPQASLPRPVRLAEIRASGRFPDWDLLRLPRLSVVPVSRPAWEAMLIWGGLGPAF